MDNSSKLKQELYICAQYAASSFAPEKQRCVQTSFAFAASVALEEICIGITFDSHFQNNILPLYSQKHIYIYI
jgi:hypothetical protein